MNPTNTGTSEQEVIDSVRRAREEEVRFFSCAAKSERERWVVREFLTRLGLEFFGDELKSEADDSPVDVTFRSASFQIKEISDPAQRRHAEIKESLRRAQKTTTVRDLVGSVTGRDIVFADVGKLLFDIAATSKYSPSVKADLDLLVYVTRPHAAFDEPHHVAANKLKSLGWRSISCLFGEKPILLVATSHSPPFLCPKDQTPNHAMQRTAPRSDA
jgi:hypothetical protein